MNREISDNIRDFLLPIEQCEINGASDAYTPRKRTFGGHPTRAALCQVATSPFRTDWQSAYSCLRAAMGDSKVPAA